MGATVWEMTDSEINEAVSRKLRENIVDGRIYLDAVDDDVMAESHPIPDYCHSIEAAFEIMEKHDIALFKTKQGRWCTYTNFGLSEDQTEEWYFRAENLEWKKGGIFVADTAPMAICLAFLKLP